MTSCSLIGFLELIPDAQPRGARVREQHVAFGLRPAVVDHHVDDVAALDGDFAAWSLKLLDGDEAFALIAEVDDNFFGVDR